MSVVLRTALAALLAVVISGGPVAATGPELPGPEALLNELGRERVVTHSETGGLRFAGGTRARPSASRERLGRPRSARVAGEAFVARYGQLFGVRDPRQQLRIDRTIADSSGSTFVRFRQFEGSVPVLAGELTVHVDGAGNVIAALGEASPTTTGIDLQPRNSAASARRELGNAVAREHGLAAADLSFSEPELWIYDPALLGAPGPAGARLVWRVEAHNIDRGVADVGLVDAAVGAVALRYSLIGHLKDRRVCDANGTSSNLPCTAPLLIETSDPSGIADADNAFTFAGDTYDFFFNRFGHDSLDGNGMSLAATVRFCDDGACNPARSNAFWYDGQATFWPGMAVDDVVAHEFVHGFTEYTSGLAYVYQSGAINEALSDIFGEFVDLTNAGAEDPSQRWLIAEGSALGAIRFMKNPPAFGQPDRMRSSLYWADPNFVDDGGVHVNSGVANKAAYLMTDGDSFNAQTVTGLGIDKAAAIWYRVATGYLASGSDYEDLGLALNQACSDLVGSAVKDGTGSDAGTIAGADCAEVAKAVTATEMALQPTTPGAAVPEAPVCTSGTPAHVFFDQIAEGHPGWTANNTRWTYSDEYATSAPWHLRGFTPAVAGGGNIRRTSLVTIPANAFLHFRHAFFFDHDATGRYDGGIVEYQVGNSWVDARTLFTHNGYNGTITNWSGGNNPLAGRQAFTRWSNGYYSSRLNLASLAGQSVRFRFRTGTDKFVADYGWFVDDVRLYTCVGGGDTTPPTVSPPNTNIRTGVAVGTGSTPVKVNVSFTASDASGISKTQLQRRANTGSWSNVSLATATSTAKNLKLATSMTTTRQFRARATDKNGNVSDWATADPFRVLAFQDGAAGNTQSGSWTSASNSNFYGGTVRRSTSAGARQVRTGTFSDLAIVSARGPNRGRAQVWVDGVLVATIDLYAAKVKYRQVVFAVDFGAPGTHNIEWRVLGTRNAKSSGTRVDFDAFLGLAP